MANRVWYPFDGMLQDSEPGSWDYNQGWIVDKKATGNYARIYPSVVQDTSCWLTSEPTGPPAADVNGMYWTGYQVDGTYDAGNWVLSYRMRNNSYYAQKGYLKMRLWKFDKMDYTTFIELTSGWVSSSLISWTAASQDQTGTITWTSESPIVFSGNQYGLVLDLEWACNTSGGNNSATVYWVEGSARNVTLTSPNYSTGGGGSTWLQKGYWWQAPYHYT